MTMVMTGRRVVGRVFSSIRDAVFPLKCLACGRIFLGQPKDHKDHKDKAPLYEHMTRRVLCESCRKEARMITSPVCPRCGLMFVERFSDDHVCGACLTRPGTIGFARAVGVYDRSLKHLILAFKYRGKLQAARPLEGLLFDLYHRCYRNGGAGTQEPDLIFPVPLHKKRFRQRGFNQAFLLIRHWPLLLDDGSRCPRPVIVKDGLIRRRWTEPQVGLNWKLRRSNLKGAFVLCPGLDVRGKHVLLIDDVYTTGATAEECASVLAKNGARHIDILTVARTA